MWSRPFSARFSFVEFHVKFDFFYIRVRTFWTFLRGSGLLQKNKQTNKQKHGEATRNLGRFPFVRTDRPEHSCSNDNFPFNQNSPARSVKSWMASTEETVFQQKLLEKAYFVIKLTGRAMVRPDSFDKWTALLYFNFKTLFQTLSWLFQLVQFVTVRLLEPGHLEEDHPVTRFMKTKDSQVFLQKDQ